jgi:hypothetical protein
MEDFFAAICFWFWPHSATKLNQLVFNFLAVISANKCVLDSVFLCSGGIFRQYIFFFLLFFSAKFSGGIWDIVAVFSVSNLLRKNSANK